MFGLFLYSKLTFNDKIKHMKTNISIIALFLIVLSCGTKTGANLDLAIKASNDLATKTDANKNLTELKTEGALTDKDGFKDIGSFQHSVFYDKKTNELFKIQNTEITDKTIIETYYFASNNVYLIVSESQQTPTKRVYVKKRKTISSENINSEEENLLLHKALYFQKEFKKSH